MQRRYGPDLDARMTMNGFELGKYEAEPVHVFFGFTLASCPEDPRFVDPWWEQKLADCLLLGWPEQLGKIHEYITFLDSPLAPLALHRCGIIGSVDEARVHLRRYREQLLRPAGGGEVEGTVAGCRLALGRTRTAHHLDGSYREFDPVAGNLLRLIASLPALPEVAVEMSK